MAKIKSFKKKETIHPHEILVIENPQSYQDLHDFNALHSSVQLLVRRSGGMSPKAVKKWFHEPIKESTLIPQNIILTIPIGGYVRPSYKHTGEGYGDLDVTDTERMNSMELVYGESFLYFWCMHFGTKKIRCEGPMFKEGDFLRLVYTKTSDGYTRNLLFNDKPVSCSTSYVPKEVWDYLREEDYLLRREDIHPEYFKRNVFVAETLMAADR